MSRMFQINEDDLADLEQMVPHIVERIAAPDPNTRTAIRRVQTILMNVRWNYGPPTDVEEIEAT